MIVIDSCYFITSTTLSIKDMSLITSFRGLAPYLKSDEIESDNFIFRLHYRYTLVILLIFSLAITAKQHFGSPIECIGDKKALEPKILDTFCWVSTTYSNPEDWRKEVGTEIAYPGVANSEKANESKPRVYHAYYQWVLFVLLFQALLFWIPRLIWKSIEKDQIKNLMLDLEKHTLKQEEREKKCGVLSSHLFDNRIYQGYLIFWYLMVEICNLLNVIGQMHMIHRFLGGKFWEYGIKFLSENPNDDPIGFDSLMEVFPRMTKCTFHMYGPSGDVMKNDAFCLLSVNILNEKIFLIIWFWFVVLAIITFCGIIYRILSIFIPDMRIIVTNSRCPLMSRETAENLVSKLSVNDWFILDRIGKNADGFNYKTLCEIYYSKFKDYDLSNNNSQCEKLDNVYISGNMKDTIC